VIALSCTGKTIDENIRNIEHYRKYLGIVELRVDFLDLAERSRIEDFPSKAGLPAILTYRKPEDGGVAPEIDEALRFDILKIGLRGGYSYLDIEDDALPEYVDGLCMEAEKNGTKVIKSFHDFGGVPENLYDRMEAAAQSGRFIPKAAVMPKGTADMLKIIEVSRRLTDEAAGRAAAADGFILLGMGIYGFPTRILAKALGSMLTFTSPAGASAAPGHVTPLDLADYGYELISRKSRIYGIIGNPVMHSRSPHLHNSGYRKQGIDAVYLPFETSDPKLILENADMLNLGGLSVTIPHKQSVISLADSIDESAEEIGACNTLVNRGGDEGWAAFNTDWLGFLKPLEGEPLEGKAALVIGAGGAARAVVYALVKRGMKVTIINRTAAKAEKLAADFGCRGGGIDSALCAVNPSLVVQTTSVGMNPEPDADPLPGFEFSGSEIVYDLIYTPEKTLFLSRAETAGCRIINGYPMLVSQAEEQFLLFTGCKASF